MNFVGSVINTGLRFLAGVQTVSEDSVNHDDVGGDVTGAKRKHADDDEEHDDETGSRKLTFEDVIKDVTFLNLNLPGIVIIGNESSGKSSTLERICNKEVFPRDKDLCTKQPIELKLRTNLSIPAKEAEFKLRIPGHEVFSTKLESEVRDRITEHMKTLKQLSTDAIKIEIESNDVLTLDLVDLPGLYTIHRDHNDEENNKCVKNYIQQRDVGAIVVVLSSNNDIFLDNAIKMIQELSVEKRNCCIAVFTKPDCIVDSDWGKKDSSGPLDKLLKLFCGTAKNYCQAGCVAITNRDTSLKVKRSLEEQKKDEDEFFLRHFNESNSDGMVRDIKSVDRTCQRSNKRQKKSKEEIEGSPPRELTEIGKERLGLEALIKQINTVFCRHLAQHWVPKKLQQLISEIQDYNDLLDGLGPDPRDITVDEIQSETLLQITSMFRDRDVYLPIWDLVSPVYCMDCQRVPQLEVDHAMQDIKIRNSFLHLFESSMFIDSVKKILSEHIRQHFGKYVTSRDLKLARFSGLLDSLIKSLMEAITKQEKSFVAGMRNSITNWFEANHGTHNDISYVQTKMKSHVIFEFTEHILMTEILDEFAFATRVTSTLDAVPDEDCAEQRKDYSDKIIKLKKIHVDLTEFQAKHRDLSDPTALNSLSGSPQ